MYPDIAPDVRVEKTISHPIRDEEVIGFVGRNKLLGQTAVVMKQVALSDGFNGPVISVPKEQAELLSDGAELLFLFEDTVLAMDGSDFETECHIATHQGRGQTVEMPDVAVDNAMFRSFPRRQVTVSN